MLPTTFGGAASFPNVPAVKSRNLMGANKSICVRCGTRGSFSSSDLISAKVLMCAATTGGFHPRLINAAWMKLFAPLFPFVCHFRLHPCSSSTALASCALSVSCVCIGSQCSSFKLQRENPCMLIYLFLRLSPPCFLLPYYDPLL